MLVIAPDDVEKLVGRVVPVAAVPHAVDVFARHGHAAADGPQRTERRLVVVAVDEAVLVLQVRARVARLEPTVDDEVAARVVDHIPAVLAQNAVVHRNLVGHPVERFHRTSQVVAQDEAVGELRFLAVFLIKDVQVGRREWIAVVFVADAQGLGADLVGVVAQLVDRYFIGSEQAFPIVGEVCRRVDEGAVGGVFQPDERRGDERQPVVAHHDGVGRGQGRRLKQGAPQQKAER